MHAGCVFVAGNYTSRMWRSESFKSARWNACVNRLDLSLYSHPKAFWGNGVRTHVNSKGKIPSTGKNLLREESNPRCCIKQDSEPNTLPTELFWPPYYQTSISYNNLAWHVSTFQTYNQRLTQKMNSNWVNACIMNPALKYINCWTTNSTT